MRRGNQANKSNNKNHNSQYNSINKDDDEEKDEYLEDVKPINYKVAKIKKKCVGDLAAKFAKADKDCEAAKEFGDKLKVLMKYDNRSKF